MSNGIDHEALKFYLLTTTFIVAQEDAGVPFLLGRRVKVEQQSAQNPTMAKGFWITPVGINLKDSRFNRLFDRLKPAVLRIMKEGDVLCVSGIILQPEVAPNPPLTETVFKGVKP